jgi:uncharacterized DUF497 family protein
MVTWDEAKRRRNIAKHGIDLADAEGFDFDHAIFEEDRDSRGEQRFRAIGPIGDRLFYLVYTYQGDEAHAISLREAEPKERRRYLRGVSPTHER